MAATAVLSQHQPDKMWENYLANLEEVGRDASLSVSVDDCIKFESREELERFLQIVGQHPDREFAHHVAFLTCSYEELKEYLIALHEETRRLIREQLSKARAT